jgi:hypothetical protein
MTNWNDDLRRAPVTVRIIIGVLQTLMVVCFGMALATYLWGPR